MDSRFEQCFAIEKLENDVPHQARPYVVTNPWTCAQWKYLVDLSALPAYLIAEFIPSEIDRTEASRMIDAAKLARQNRRRLTANLVFESEQFMAQHPNYND